MATRIMPHAALMDRVYRRQRHVYDATRRYYLLGRDHLIATLAPPDGGLVLELGCGTGRNLVAAARAYPSARLHGLDISAAMLDSARAALARSGLAGRVQLGRGDATNFAPADLFAVDRFDRIYLSYAISMIPDWRGTLRHAVAHLAPAGSLHIIDFGQQEGLPRWFRRALFTWLGWFHVHPRGELKAELSDLAGRYGARLVHKPLHRGYAWHFVLKLDGPA